MEFDRNTASFSSQSTMIYSATGSLSGSRSKVLYEFETTVGSLVAIAVAIAIPFVLMVIRYYLLFRSNNQKSTEIIPKIRKTKSKSEIRSCDDEIEMKEQIDETNVTKSYRAIHNGKVVALMKIKSDVTEKERDQFRLGVKILLELTHPNVIQILKPIGNDGMMMEYLENGSLYNLIHTQNKILRIEQVIHISKGIAAGLAYIHSKNIIHKDIKSGNILLDSNFVPKIANFDLARIKSTTLSMTRDPSELILLNSRWNSLLDGTRSIERRTS